jgi:hypothetical protein
LADKADKVAVVGSREGADLEQVRAFMVALHEKYPETLIVSGGATGVDHTAEQTWLSLGGSVWSFRPVTLVQDIEYGIEKWELGREPRVFSLANEPTWANYKSAAIYRDMLIADECDRLVAFYRAGRSPGASLTAELADKYGHPVHEFEREQS